MIYTYLVEKHKNNYIFKKGGNNMELEIQDALEKDYRYVLIKVEYYQLRTYKITLTLNYLTEKDLSIEFLYVYESKMTFDKNITHIESLIDIAIIKLLKGE